jgi:hypothetical protein
MGETLFSPSFFRPEAFASEFEFEFEFELT